jgi:hypothetical protein
VRYPKQQIPSVYRFDDVVVERNNFRVLRRGQAQTLEPRAFDVGKAEVFL